MALFISSNSLYGQELTKAPNSPTDTNRGKEVFTIVEVQPQYPGGEKARQKYLIENIKYPDQAQQNKVKGTVYVTFIVEPDGAISDITILRGIGSGCDEEVLRVMKNMPKWVPGTQRGKNVRVKINLPIKFE